MGRGKDKARRFAETYTFDNMVQPPFEEIFGHDHKFKGRWREDFFGNGNPIVLELGCGRGEYTLNLAKKYPGVNFIGIDIKGARMWRGAKSALEENVANAAFLRTRIEFISSFFADGEVDGIWITFPDPQLKKSRVKKRLTAPAFLASYHRFLRPGAPIHLKTDSRHLHDYTLAVVAHNSLVLEEACPDIYGCGMADELLSIKTAYETKFLACGLPITYLRFNLGPVPRFCPPLFIPDDGLA